MNYYPKLLCIITVALLIGTCGVSDISLKGGSGTETVGIMGVLIDENGTITNGASVSLYAYDSLSVSNPVAETLTNDTGSYIFSSISSGMYTIIGYSPDNEKAVFIGPVYYDSLLDSLMMIGYDTLFAPGTIIGCVNPDNPRAGIISYIPGTSYMATTDDQGTYTLTGIPRGKYNVYYSTSGYITGKDTGVIVSSGSVTQLKCFTLRVDPDGAPPAPELESVSYDGTTGTVALIWKTVLVDDLSEYLVFRLSSDTSTRIGTTSDTTFTDTLFGPEDTLPCTVSYKIKSSDTLENESSFSNSLQLKADPPEYFKTLFKWTISTLDGKVDTLSNADTVVIRVNFSNKKRINTAISWAVDKSDSIIHQRTIDTCCGTDSIFLKWTDAGVRSLFFCATDETGEVYKDSVSVTILDSLLITPRNRWVSGQPLFSGRRFSGAVATDSAIFVVGGCAQAFDPGLGNTTVVSSSVERLSSGGFWTSAPSLPQGRFYCGVTAVQDVIYVLGGCDFQNNFSSILSLSPSVDKKWNEIAQLPVPCSGIACCTFNNQIYILGGVQSSQSGRIITDSIYVFDPAGRTVSAIASLSTPRAYHQAICIGSKIFIIGGLGGSGNLSLAEALSSVEIFDLQTNLISTGPDMHATRLNFAAAPLNGVIYTIGGFGSAISNQVLSGVEALDPLEGVWNLRPELPHACHGMAAAVFRNAIYTIGGAQNGYPDLDAITNVEIYYP